MKILVISGSHRSKQATYGLAEQFAQKLQGKGAIEVEICELANLNLHSCCGMSACTEQDNKRCVNKKDDFNTLFDQMVASDAILFLVPKYSPYPSKVMAVIERLMAISWWGYGQHGKMNEFILAGKPAGIVAFTTAPGIPAEVFFPLFFNFAELGFDVVTFNQFPGLFFSRSDNQDEQMMDMVAQAFAEKLA